MSDIVKKEVCKCENCGNEAEMVVTCSLPDAEAEQTPQKRVLGTATCNHCGNEADMWIDL
jgi:hypothetical protein